MMLKFSALFRDSTLHVHLCALKAIGGLSSLFVYLTHFALTLDGSFNYKSFKTSRKLDSLTNLTLHSASTVINSLPYGQ